MVERRIAGGRQNGWMRTDGGRQNGIPGAGQHGRARRAGKVRRTRNPQWNKLSQEALVEK